MLDRFEQFCNAISSIHLSIQRIEREQMSRYGLKGPHAQCLLTMARHPQGITAARLCQLCEKDKAAISRTVAELEAAQMISREDPSGKRYRTMLCLTPRGLAVAEEVRELVSQAVSQASEGYDDRTRETFVRVLNLIAGNLQNLCEQGLQNE